MNFNKLFESELSEFLSFNGIINIPTDKNSLVFYSNALYNSGNPNIKYTLPILALYKAQMFNTYLSGYETTQREFFNDKRVNFLKQLSKDLQLEEYSPEVIKLIIFRILQIQGRVIEETNEQSIVQDYFEKVLVLVKRNNVASIIDLLNRGMSANMCSPIDHRCILWYASIGDEKQPYQVDMIRLLVSRGASLQVQGADESILENVGYATEAEVNRMLLFRDLIEIYKADPNSVQNKKENILFTTVKVGNKITTAYILNKGINPNGYIDNFNPSLNLIFEKPILNKDIPMIELLLKYKADHYLPNQKGTNAVSRLEKYIKRAKRYEEIEKIEIYDKIMNLFKRSHEF